MIFILIAKTHNFKTMHKRILEQKYCSYTEGMRYILKWPFGQKTTKSIGKLDHEYKTYYKKL